MVEDEERPYEEPVVPDSRQRLPAQRLSLEEVWPVHPTAVWPEGLSLRREDLYEESPPSTQNDSN